MSTCWSSVWWLNSRPSNWSTESTPEPNQLPHTLPICSRSIHEGPGCLESFLKPSLTSLSLSPRWAKKIQDPAPTNSASNCPQSPSQSTSLRKPLQGWSYHRSHGWCQQAHVLLKNFCPIPAHHALPVESPELQNWGRVRKGRKSMGLGHPAHVWILAPPLSQQRPTASDTASWVFSSTLWLGCAGPFTAVWFELHSQKKIHYL